MSLHETFGYPSGRRSGENGAFNQTLRSGANLGSTMNKTLTMQRGEQQLGTTLRTSQVSEDDVTGHILVLNTVDCVTRIQEARAIWAPLNSRVHCDCTHVIARPRYARSWSRLPPKRIVSGYHSIGV